MAFPGTLDISYYKGDTYEFEVYPKDSSGNQFDLTDFTEVTFTIAETRGSTTNQVEGLSQFVDNTHVLCVITPTAGESLDATKRYYYDVEIKAPVGSGYSYERVYTILTGSISVTEEVTLPATVGGP